MNEPTINGISDIDWAYSISPANPAEQDIFDSWKSVLNISFRYLDYFRKNIFSMWEADYREFIDEDHDIEHAQTIDELRNNFKKWKAAFPIKRRPGSVLYRAFQKPTNSNKMNTEEVSGKEKNFESKVVQGELFPSRDFK